MGVAYRLLRLYLCFNVKLTFCVLSEVSKEDFRFSLIANTKEQICILF